MAGARSYNISHSPLLISHLTDMKRFILLLNHDDISLSAYLQHCLVRGERFVRASGNIFTFRKEEDEGKRIAAVTYFNDDPDLKMKFQIEDYCALMKKRGWKTICAGAPEDIFDSKRHVFMETDQPEIDFPNTSPDLAAKAKKREVRSLIRCFAMLLLLFGFTVFFVHHDPDVILSSPHIFWPCAASFVFWTASLILSLAGAVTIARKAQCTDGFRHYLAVDRAVLCCILAVVCLLSAFVMDMVRYPEHSRSAVFGEKRVTIYRDELPLTLEDLGIPAEGQFRSSRKMERNGSMMRSLTCSDQSFTDPDVLTNLSMISYSLYQSEWKTGLDWVAKQKGADRYPAADELKEAWHADRVNTDGHHRLAARYPGAVLIISTITDLEEIDPDVILEKLLPDR